MQNNQRQVYEEIEDDENEQYVTKDHQAPIQQPQKYYEAKQQKFVSHQHKIQADEQQTHPQQQQNQRQIQKEVPVIKGFADSKTIDHQQLGKYANLQSQNEDGQNIKISITKSQKRGGMMSNYFVYFIQGYDTKGHFSIARRFNEFYQMRVAMVARWPGCFIPSIPAKNALSKNDVNIIKKRTRYLNDFVKKIAKSPHLYYGEEFQSLLRSEQPDISQIFSKWPAPTSQSIINKYRINFSELAGKELNSDTNNRINEFAQTLKKNLSQLLKDRQVMKQLAQSNDKVIESYGNLFTTVFPTYQKQCFSFYCDNKEADMLYMNDSEIKLQQHQTIVKQAMSSNPFWVLYDLIRHQERDAVAFTEVLQAKSKYQTKKHTIQIKISQSQKMVAELSMGKRPLGMITSKGTNDEVKYKLEVQIQELKRQKENILIIIDIISAMIVYIEIERYKSEKQSFYIKALAKVGSTQITAVQNLAQIWNGIKEATQHKSNKTA